MEQTLAPLRRYLMDQFPTELQLSLREIEGIIGARLPAVAGAARWWTTASAPKAGSHRSTWTAVGYEATLSGVALTVRFRAYDFASSSVAVDQLRDRVFPTSERATFRRAPAWRRDAAGARPSGISRRR